MPKLNLNVLTSTRRTGLTFRRSNITKIGYNCISNHLKNVSNKLNIDFNRVSSEDFKQICKKNTSSWMN